jgi:hypothetical protein
MKACFFGYKSCCIMYITCLDHDRINAWCYFMCSVLEDCLQVVGLEHMI